jgi:hypothetical protein
MRCRNRALLDSWPALIVANETNAVIQPGRPR